MEYVKSKKNTSLGKERKIKIEIVKEKGKYTEEMHSVLQDVKPLKLQSTLDGGEKKTELRMYIWQKNFYSSLIKNMKTTLANTGRNYFSKAIHNTENSQFCLRKQLC